MNNFFDKVEQYKLVGCPPATKDIKTNLANRQKAIDVANYGPLNPNEPNNEYWKAKADQFNTTPDEARKSVCGNCAFFVIKKVLLDCIAGGIGGDIKDEYEIIDAGQLGYCEAFDFKCASKRTCDVWVVGGPIKDAKLDIEPNPCWDGYEPIGLKPDGSPNCVPIKN